VYIIWPTILGGQIDANGGCGLAFPAGPHVFGHAGIDEVPNGSPHYTDKTDLTEFRGVDIPVVDVRGRKAETAPHKPLREPERLDSGQRQHVGNRQPSAGSKYSPRLLEKIIPSLKVKRTFEGQHLVKGTVAKPKTCRRPEPEVNAVLQTALRNSAPCNFDVEGRHIDPDYALHAEPLNPEKVLLGEAEPDIEDPIVRAELCHLAQQYGESRTSLCVGMCLFPVPKI
jgi:hypothetical protein